MISLKKPSSDVQNIEKFLAKAESILPNEAHQLLIEIRDLYEQITNPFWSLHKIASQFVPESLIDVDALDLEIKERRLDMDGKITTLNNKISIAYANINACRQLKLEAADGLSYQVKRGAYQQYPHEKLFNTLDSLWHGYERLTFGTNESAIITFEEHDTKITVNQFYLQNEFFGITEINDDLRCHVNLISKSFLDCLTDFRDQLKGLMK